MDDVCDSIKADAKKRIGKNYTKTDDFKFSKIYPDVIANEEVWPVFRWRCFYEIEQIEQLANPGPEKPIDFPLIPIGLDLDTYCSKIGGTIDWEGQYKDPDDYNSWYCTLVNPQVKEGKGI